MPFGYLFTVAFIAVCTAVALVPPRPRHSRPFSLAFWFAFVINEIPLVAIEFLVVSTLLAMLQGDLSSPGGIVGATIAALATAGLIAHGVRGLRDAKQLRTDVARAIGPLRVERHPLRTLQWPFPTRPRSIEHIRNVTYGEGAGQRLDVYRSRGDLVGRPTLVYFHGGAFRSGDKSRQARPLLYGLAQRGWVCVTANYPLAPRALYRDQLSAARTAVSWARSEASQYGTDPDLVVVAGSSAGAHLAATVALTDAKVCGAVCLGGYYGSADGTDPDAAPSAHLTPDAPPFLVIHGDNDTIVIVDDARDFVEHLGAVSREAVVYAELGGAQHAFDVFHSPRLEAVIDAVDAFGAVAVGR